MRKWLMVMACVSVLLGAEKSLEELEKENKILEMQLKNQELKKKLENNQSEDKQETKNIISEILTKLEKNKDEPRSGVFGGWGAGYSLMTADISHNLPQLKSDYGDFGIASSFQIGWMKMWNRYFGLQTYADLGVSFGSFGDIFEKSNNASSMLISGIYTFNIDAILNAINYDNFGVGFLIGLGMGLRQNFINYSYSFGEWLNNREGFASGSSENFEMGANLGVRFIFGRTFAIDLMVRVPFTSISTTTEIAHYSGQNHMPSKNEIHTYQYRENVTFSIRFVGGRF